MSLISVAIFQPGPSEQRAKSTKTSAPPTTAPTSQRPVSTSERPSTSRRPDSKLCQLGSEVSIRGWFGVPFSIINFHVLSLKMSGYAHLNRLCAYRSLGIWERLSGSTISRSWARMHRLTLRITNRRTPLSRWVFFLVTLFILVVY